MKLSKKEKQRRKKISESLKKHYQLFLKYKKKKLKKQVIKRKIKKIKEREKYKNLSKKEILKRKKISRTLKRYYKLDKKLKKRKIPKKERKKRIKLIFQKEKEKKRKYFGLLKIQKRFGKAIKKEVKKKKIKEFTLHRVIKKYNIYKYDIIFTPFPGYLGFAHGVYFLDSLIIDMTKYQGFNYYSIQIYVIIFFDSKYTEATSDIIGFVDFKFFKDYYHSLLKSGVGQILKKFKLGSDIKLYLQGLTIYGYILRK